ncbi:MAG: ATP-dependent endonuclease [Flavobacterium sp.]|nr:ATP-dependent endonuclease [Flavobacterium sp.]
MLQSIQFKNYRCFDEHELPLNTETIIVGRNNAGKSTIVEGLRLVAIITQRIQNLAFRKVPDWIELPSSHRGVGVSLAGLNISWQNIFHRYQDPPGKILANFANGYKLTVHIGPDKKTHAVIQKSNNNVIENKGQAITAKLPKISVLPQISPLQKEENILSVDYVKANISSHLSSNHFRNQLVIFYEEYFEEFKSLAEESWPGLQITSLEGRKNLPGEPIELLVRDGDFVAEVGWMGHGLQMWLQTMWFITLSKQSDTIILDEPDVYMHPDLQRKLLRFIRGQQSQCIVATHSTEILAETKPNNILIIERSRKKSSFSTNLPAVQKILEEIGSAQNIHLTRLWSAGRLLLVEGKDIKYLKHFQNIIFPDTKYPFDALPNMPIGGWSGWPYAIGSAMLLTNAFDEKIITYCILDADYYPPDTIQNRFEESEKKNVNLHIWSKKEIENYLIKSPVIERIITKNSKNGSPSVIEIERQIEKITSSLKDQTIDCFSQEFHNDDRKKGIASANKKARKLVENSWATISERLSIISGKKTISKLSSWSTKNYGVSFGANTLLYEIQLSELEQEIIDVIRAIENTVKFMKLSN